MGRRIRVLVSPDPDFQGPGIAAGFASATGAGQLPSNTAAVRLRSERVCDLQPRFPELDAALAKTEIVYPSVPLQATEPKTYAGGPLRVLFVGNDFAQKGGVAAVRLAKMARKEGVEVEVDVVSALRYGRQVFADCPDRGVYDADLELLKAPNVRYHGSLPNSDVLKLMAASHFLLLTSLDDTFGFSVIEAMSVGTPALVSNVCALPELVSHGENGAVVELPLDRYRKWHCLEVRGWGGLDFTYRLLAEKTYCFLKQVMDNPSSYEELSAGAIRRIKDNHDADKVGARLDAIYEEAVA